MQLQTIVNQTTGDNLSGQVIDQHLTVQIDIAGSLNDVSRGDTLTHADRHFFTLYRESQSGLYSAPYVSIMALRANQKATFTRSGSVIAEVPCHCSVQDLPGSRLHDLLSRDTAHGVPLRDETERVKILKQAVAMLLDPADAVLASVIQKRIDQHANARRIFTQAGSGVAAGDLITVADFTQATVSRIDRKSFPGLEVLTCNPTTDQAVAKPSLLRKLTGA